MQKEIIGRKKLLMERDSTREYVFVISGQWVSQSRCLKNDKIQQMNGVPIMKSRITGLVVCALILSLSPTISLADYYGYRGGPRVHHQGPGPSYYGQRGYYHGGYRHPAPYYRHYPPPSAYYRHHRYYNDDWVAPVAILGAAVLGAAVISSSYNSPPPPPQRMCQDAYNHVDQYGQYLYTEYVDRPCR